MINKEVKVELEAIRRYRILEYAREYGNVVAACRDLGVPRSSFYRWKRAFEMHGRRGLRRKKPIARSHPRQIPPAYIERILHLRLHYLVIVGGGPTAEIMERFIELGVGAEEGRFVIVPTAGGNYDREGYPRAYHEERVVAPWRERGVRHVSMLHTHNPSVADNKESVAELTQATAVWFNGGRQWNIVDSYAGTRTYDEFHRVLQRGGVIGGSSAGATIQGQYLVRGDTQGSEIVMTDEEEHQLGFEFLRKSAIDPHINSRNRWEDIISLIEKRPHLLGIGLSEGTAIIVTGDVFEVVGESIIAVHDNTRAYPWGEPFLFLAPGDFYDMKGRQIVAPGMVDGSAHDPGG